MGMNGIDFDHIHFSSHKIFYPNTISITTPAGLQKYAVNKT